jgi:hypothetical protein
MNYRVITTDETGNEETLFRGNYKDCLDYINSGYRHQLLRGRTHSRPQVAEFKFKYDGKVYSASIAEAQAVQS